MRPEANRAHTGFKIEPLADTVAVGAVSARAAFLWLRSERPGELLITYERLPAGPAVSFRADAREDGGTDRTFLASLPPPGEAPLEPGSRYCFRVQRTNDGVMLGEGGFETAPASPQSAPHRFAIALMSCNQPFDDDGVPLQRAAQMLEAAAECLAEHDTKLVLTVGDQMYTDYPPGLSLFEEEYFRTVAPPGRARITDCSAAEVRALLQQRHRVFLAAPGWRRLHARYACYPLPDDHEMVDNWGSDAAHSTAEWQAFREGGRAAYFDYQGSRVLGRDEVGADFDFEIDFGPVAIYALDVRSNRAMHDADHGQICSAEQERRLEEFLARHADRDALGIVLPVPMVHLPRWAVRLGHLVMRGGEDLSDRWSAPAFIGQRDRLLGMLHRHQRAHPEQRIMMLSGDIHVACAHEIVWEDGTRPLLQLVSSGITNHVDRATQLAARLSILAKMKLTCDSVGRAARVPLVPGTPPYTANPYTELNLGLIEFDRTASGRYRLRFLVYGHNGPKPICVYRSGWF